MTAPAAFKGTFADFRLVKTRKIAQFVIEVAIEQADAALAALGGLPRSDAETWCGIARIDPNASQKPAQAPAKPKQKWDELPYAQQAAIRCGEEQFWKFLSEKNGFYHSGVGDAASTVRSMCGVESRSDIIRGRATGYAWATLDKAYLDWIATQQHQHYVR